MGLSQLFFAIPLGYLSDKNRHRRATMLAVAGLIQSIAVVLTIYAVSRDVNININMNSPYYSKHMNNEEDNSYTTPFLQTVLSSFSYSHHTINIYDNELYSPTTNNIYSYNYSKNSTNIPPLPPPPPPPPSDNRSLLWTLVFTLSLFGISSAAMLSVGQSLLADSIKTMKRVRPYTYVTVSRYHYKQY